MQEVSLEEAVTRLPQLIAEVNEGEDIVLTQNSQPVARLVAVTPSPSRPRREAGTAKGLILYIAEDFDAPLV